MALGHFRGDVVATLHRGDDQAWGWSSHVFLVTVDRSLSKYIIILEIHNAHQTALHCACNALIWYFSFYHIDLAGVEERARTTSS